MKTDSFARDVEAARIARLTSEKARDMRQLITAIILFGVLAGLSGFFN